MDIRVKRLWSKLGVLASLCRSAGQQSSVLQIRFQAMGGLIQAATTLTSLENKSTLLSGGCHLTCAVVPGMINAVVRGE